MSFTAPPWFSTTPPFWMIAPPPFLLPSPSMILWRTVPPLTVRMLKPPSLWPSDRAFVATLVAHSGDAANVEPASTNIRAGLACVPASVLLLAAEPTSSAAPFVSTSEVLVEPL